jgi:hypothetical protein
MFRFIRALCPLVLIVVSGCAVQAPTLDPTLRLPLGEEVLARIASARTCSDPVVPRVRLSAGFKYGCFCGKGHPSIAPPPESGSPAERARTLALAYLAIRPVDSIDEACRDHDICWILHSDGSGECNDEFRERLDYIADYMRKIDKDSTRSLEWRCRILAGDMSAAFVTVLVEDKYKDEAKSAGAAIGKLFTAPLAAILPVLRLPVWAKEPYPKDGERCVAPPLQIAAAVP